MSLVVALLTNKFNIVDRYSGDIQIRLLQCFSQSENWYVRYSVADYPNTPVQLLHGLSKDEDWSVRQAAKAQLKKRGL